MTNTQLVSPNGNITDKNEMVSLKGTLCKISMQKGDLSYSYRDCGDRWSNPIPIVPPVKDFGGFIHFACTEQHDIGVIICAIDSNAIVWSTVLTSINAQWSEWNQTTDSNLPQISAEDGYELAISMSMSLFNSKARVSILYNNNDFAIYTGDYCVSSKAFTSFNQRQISMKNNSIPFYPSGFNMTCANVNNHYALLIIGFFSRWLYAIDDGDGLNFIDITPATWNNPLPIEHINSAVVEGDLHVVFMSNNGTQFNHGIYNGTIMAPTDFTDKNQFPTATIIQNTQASPYTDICCAQLDNVLHVLAGKNDGTYWHSIRRGNNEWMNWREIFKTDISSLSNNLAGAYIKILDISGHEIFISVDKKGGDNIVELHNRDDVRNWFSIQAPHLGDNQTLPDQYRITFSPYAQTLFVSNDTGSGDDNIIESHTIDSSEERNLFQFLFNPYTGYPMLYSSNYQKYVFCSGDSKGGCDMVEAHSGLGFQDRYYWQLACMDGKTIIKNGFGRISYVNPSSSSYNRNTYLRAGIIKGNLTFLYTSTDPQKIWSSQKVDANGWKFTPFQIPDTCQHGVQAVNVDSLGNIICIDKTGTPFYGMQSDESLDFKYQNIFDLTTNTDFGRSYTNMSCTSGIGLQIKFGISPCGGLFYMTQNAKGQWSNQSKVPLAVMDTQNVCGTITNVEPLLYTANDNVQKVLLMVLDDNGSILQTTGALQNDSIQWPLIFQNLNKIGNIHENFIDISIANQNKNNGCIELFALTQIGEIYWFTFNLLNQEITINYKVTSVAGNPGYLCSISTILDGEDLYLFGLSQDGTVYRGILNSKNDTWSPFRRITPLAQDNPQLPNMLWMEDVYKSNNDFGKLPLGKICFPCTHDTGTYNLSSQFTKDPNPMVAEIMQKLNEIKSKIDVIPFISRVIDPADWVTSIGAEVFKKLGTATTSSVAKQLNDGIRCLDLRIYYNYSDPANPFYAYHGVVGASLNEMLLDVADFVSASSGEIIYITLGHWQDDKGEFDTSKLQQLINTITGNLKEEECFTPQNAAALGKLNLFECTYNEITRGNLSGDRHSKVILVMKNSEIAPKLLWPETLYSPPFGSADTKANYIGEYTNTDNLTDMISSLKDGNQGQQYYSKLAKNQRPFALYLTLTPQPDVIYEIIKSKAVPALLGISLWCLAIPFIGPFLSSAIKAVALDFSFIMPSYDTLEELTNSIYTSYDNSIQNIIQKEFTGTDLSNPSFVYIDFYENYTQSNNQNQTVYQLVELAKSICIQQLS